jgi:hypothetical protein
MTRDDAITIVAMIVHGWPGPAWEEERLAIYVEDLLPYDAAITTRALARARNEIKYRPSLAELRDFIQAERRASEASVPLVEPNYPPKPDWIDRWERARAAKDMRPFPEQAEAMHAFARRSPEDYKAYAPPGVPTSDREFWVQPDEYQEGQAPGLPAIVAP